MAITLTFGTTAGGRIDINDGTDYVLLEGFDPGEKVKSFNEAQSYAGTVAQYDVSEANLIEVTVPLLVKGSNLTDLRAHITALNDKIDAGAQELVFNDGTGAITYNTVHSPRVAFRPDSMAINKFKAVVTMTLYRTP